MNISVKFLFISLATLSLFAHVVPGAEIYRWVDENGNVHYSDKPESENAVQVPVSNHISEPDNSRIRKRQRLLDVMDEERQEKNKTREDILTATAERKLKCDQVTKRLQQFLESGFLYEETDDPFNPRILSSEEKNSAIESARQDVQRWCGSGN